MATAWFVKIQGQATGPLTLGQLQTMASAGQLLPQSPVSMDGQIWTAAAKVKGLVFGSVPTVQPAPAAQVPAAAAPVPVSPVPFSPAPADPDLGFLSSGPASSPSRVTPYRPLKKNNDSATAGIIVAVLAVVGLGLAAAYFGSSALSPPNGVATRPSPNDAPEDIASTKPDTSSGGDSTSPTPSKEKEPETKAAVSAPKLASNNAVVVYGEDASGGSGLGRSTKKKGATRATETSTQDWPESRVDEAAMAAAANAPIVDPAVGNVAGANPAADAAGVAGVNPVAAGWLAGQSLSGSTNQSEEAVDRGLKWLAEHQTQYGTWSYDHRLGPCQNRCADPGTMPEAVVRATAQALLAFISHGNTHAGGPYQQQVTAGLTFLIGRMGRDGSLWEKGGRMYSHALATLALCEDLRISRETMEIATSEGQGALPTPVGVVTTPEADAGAADRSAPLPGTLHARGARLSYHDKHAAKAQRQAAAMAEAIIIPAANRAVVWLQAAQDKSAGGWRYEVKPDSDISVTGWAVMALYSAKKSNLYVQPTWPDTVNKFLDKIQTDQYGSEYGYHLVDDKKATPTRSSIGLLARLYTNWTGAEQGFVQGIEKLSRHGPSNTELYYDYYGTLLMHHVGGQQWDQWNQRMREHLISTQDTNGHQNGSWNFPGGFGTGPGGRHYNTCMAILILETYYRSKPILATSDGTGQAIPQQ